MRSQNPEIFYRDPGFGNLPKNIPLIENNDNNETLKDKNIPELEEKKSAEKTDKLNSSTKPVKVENPFESEVFALLENTIKLGQEVDKKIIQELRRLSLQDVPDDSSSVQEDSERNNSESDSQTKVENEEGEEGRV